MVDDGDIQTTDPEVLKLFVDAQLKKKSASQESVTIQATKQVNYRQQGISYSSNELFVDVTENLNVIVNGIGTTL